MDTVLAEQGEIERKVFCQTPSKERHVGEMGNNT